MSGWPAERRCLVNARLEYAGLTRGERVHNLLTRLLQVIAVASMIGSFQVEDHSLLQLGLRLGGLACLFVAAAMGRFVVIDDE